MFAYTKIENFMKSSMKSSKLLWSILSVWGCLSSIYQMLHLLSLITRATLTFSSYFSITFFEHRSIIERFFVIIKIVMFNLNTEINLCFQQNIEVLSKSRERRGLLIIHFEKQRDLVFRKFGWFKGSETLLRNHFVLRK